MDADLLITADGRAALARAAEQADPTSLAAAQALRKSFAPALAASALEQEHLRLRARSKFGAAASGMLFTAAGLEQATRPSVAQWRAQRFVDAGVREVVDLGCGIGADARAFADAGLRVRAVERDPNTAIVARHNLAGLDAEVICADAVEAASELLRDPGTGVFCDPARRTDRGRTWRVDQFTPPWDFVLDLLGSGHPTCIKLGPGLPGELVPDDVEARWVSDHGDVVEVGLWMLPGARAGRAATLLPGDHDLGPEPRGELPVRAPRGFLLEPDGAVLRAGLAPYIAPDADLAQLAPGVGYLTCDQPVRTPFATCFEVLDVLDAGEKPLRRWVRAHEVGTLEIKKRAVEIDPAVLRRRLKPSGPHSATLVLTPTVDGVRALVVRRLS